MEQWRDIPGWVGYYQVSDTGRVRSVKRTLQFADGRVREYVGGLRTTHVDGFGYQKVTLKRAGKNQRALIHQLVALAWLGPRPPGLDVCHGDGNKLNNTATNLRYDTRAANHADAVRHGTAHRPRKFDNALVSSVQDAEGMTYRQMADKFGMSVTHVFNLRNGHRRKD